MLPVGRTSGASSPTSSAQAYARVTLPTQEAASRCLADLRAVSLLDLPNEILDRICRRLALGEIVQFSRVCRRLNDIARAHVIRHRRSELGMALCTTGACRDVLQTRRLLRVGNDTTVVDDAANFNRSALWWAALRGHAHMVRFLLSVPHAAVGASSALIVAASYGRAEIVRALLEAGADINARDDTEPNAIASVNSDAREGVIYQSRWGTFAVSVSRDYQRLPVIMHAGPRRSVRMTVGASANAHHWRFAAWFSGQLSGAPSRCRVTPLRHAVEAGALDVVAVLLAHPDIEPNLDAPLAAAARSGNLAVVRRLLEYPSVDPNLVDVDGWSPLEAAMLGGHSLVVQELQARGARPISAPRARSLSRTFARAALARSALQRRL